jgi:hypothetical protein
MSINKLWSLLLLATLSFFTACLDDEEDYVNESSITYDFSDSDNGWTGDFADYPVGEEDFYELGFSHDTLPAPLDSTQMALRLTGSNRSDDLFLFAKRKITGLVPNATYELEFDVEIATDAPESGIGAGGSPGASNYLKVGASGTEPMKVATEGFYGFNLDKGNQSQGGEDAIVIGNIGHAGEEYEYQLIQRSSAGTTFTATTNANGEIWVFVGVDSGFEGITTFYITQLRVTFR